MIVYSPRELTAKLSGSPFKLHYRTTFRGLPISIENRKGSKRRWGKEPEQFTRMKLPYGYIRGTEGNDGDEVDVYLGPDKKSDFVFIVNQRRHDDTRKFDEHKVMLGFTGMEDARKAYLSHYDSSGPKMLGSIRMWTMERFKKWLGSAKAQGGPVSKSLAVELRLEDLRKGLFIGPRGGKWADAKHTIPWHTAKPDLGVRGKKGIEALKSEMRGITDVSEGFEGHPKEAHARELWIRQWGEKSTTGLALAGKIARGRSSSSERRAFAFAVYGNPRVTKEDARIAAAMAVRQYAATQAVFATKGVTSVTLYRGVSAAQGAALRGQAGGDKRAELKLRSLSSWASDKESAQEFGQQYGSGGALVEVEVPVAAILAHHAHDEQRLEENEVLLMSRHHLSVAQSAIEKVGSEGTGDGSFERHDVRIPEQTEKEEEEAKAARREQQRVRDAEHAKEAEATAEVRAEENRKARAEEAAQKADKHTEFVAKVKGIVEQWSTASADDRKAKAKDVGGKGIIPGFFHVPPNWQLALRVTSQGDLLEDTTRRRIAGWKGATADLREQLGLGEIVKSALFIGPRGGKWADAAHTIPWKEDGARHPSREEEGIPDRLLSKVVNYAAADAAWGKMTALLEDLDKDLKEWGASLGYSGRVARKGRAKTLAALKEKTLAKIPVPEVVRVGGLTVETIASSIEQHTAEMVEDAFEWRERGLFEKDRGEYLWPGKDLRESFGTAGANKVSQYNETFFKLGRSLKAWREANQPAEEERTAWEGKWKHAVKVSLRDVAALPKSHQRLLEASEVRTRFLVHTSTSESARAFVAGEATRDSRLHRDAILMYSWSSLGKEDPEQGTTLAHEVGHIVERIVRRTLTPREDFASDQHRLSELFAGQESVRPKDPSVGTDNIHISGWMRSHSEWFAEAYRHAYRGGEPMKTTLKSGDFDAAAFRRLVDRKVAEALSSRVRPTHDQDNEVRLLKGLLYIALRKSQRPPGGGWQPIPGGKKGGFRKRKGKGWEYWYPDEKPTFAWGVSRWTEHELAEGKFDKNPSHWAPYHAKKGQAAVGGDAGGVNFRSKHPVKEAGLPHRLYQVVKAGAKWVKLRDVHSGETRDVERSRVMPVYHLIPQKEPSPKPLAPTGSEPQGAQGPSGGSPNPKGTRIPPFTGSRAREGTALAAMESGRFLRHKEVVYETDASGNPRKVTREKTHVDALTKEKLIEEFGPMISKIALSTKQRFGLRSQYTSNPGERRVDETLVELRMSAIEGLLVAMERYAGAAPFALSAKSYAMDYAALHAGREFAGGLALPRRLRRMLGGFAAAKAQVARFALGEPSAAQIAKAWDLRKWQVHTGIAQEDPQYNEPVPMREYTLKIKQRVTTEEGKKRKITTSTDTRTQPGKLEWAERMHSFLTGQKTARGSDFFDENASIFPTVSTGVGLSPQEKVDVRVSIAKILPELRQHQITVTSGRQSTTYRADTAAIIMRKLGLEGDLEEVADSVIAQDVDIERKTSRGWVQLAQRQKTGLISTLMERGLETLRARLEDDDKMSVSKIVARAQDRLAPAEHARPGLTYRLLLEARSREVTKEQVAAWRSKERTRLRGIRDRMLGRISKMRQGPDRDQQTDMVAGTERALRRISSMGRKEIALKIAHARSSEMTPAIRRMQTATIDVDFQSPGHVYGWAVTTMTDIGTGKQRRVRVRTIKATPPRPAGQPLKKSEQPPIDEGILRDMLRWPRLTWLLWGRESIPTPERFHLESLIGLH